MLGRKVQECPKGSTGRERSGKDWTKSKQWAGTGHHKSHVAITLNRLSKLSVTTDLISFDCMKISHGSGVKEWNLKNIRDFTNKSDWLNFSSDLLVIQF